MADIPPGLKDLMVAANRRLTGAAPPLTPAQVSQLRDNLGRRAILRAPVAAAVPVRGRSDGLRAPMNAPPAADLTPGVAAGASTPIVRANLVIISGPSGAVVGLFVYAPGTTPALGNPPIAWVSSSAVDPFGNVLPATTGVAGTGTFRAGNTLITPAGDFIYSGTPVLGNLIATVGANGSPDPSGNTTYTGVVSYLPTVGSGTPHVVAQLQSGSLIMGPPAALAGTGGATPGSIGGTTGTGQVNILSGGTSGADAAAELQLVSQLLSGAGTAEVIMSGALVPLVQGDPSGAGPFVYARLNGNMPSGKSFGISGGLDITQTDFLSFTNATTSLNQMSRVWSVPFGDLYNNAGFRLVVWGHGTQGSTQQQLNTQISGLGTTFAGNNMPATDIPASAAFHWRYELEVIINGGAGTALFGGQFTWSQAAVTANRGTAALDGTVGSLPGVNTNLTLQMGWNAIVGGPTITSIGSTFERIGSLRGQRQRGRRCADERAPALAAGYHAHVERGQFVDGLR